MNEKYSIELANNNNVEELLELSKIVTNHNNRQFLSDERVDAFLNSEYFISEVTDQIENMTVIKDNHKIIGFCVWNENELVSLMVAPAYQGKGVAKYFLETLTNKKLKKHRELKLICFKDNIRANKFYKKLGWILKDTFFNEDMKLYQNKYIISDYKQTD